MGNSVAVTFTYRRDEYIQAIRRHYISTLQLRRDLIAGILGILLGGYLTFVVNIWIGWLLLAIGLVLLMMLGYAVWLLPALIYRSQPKLRDEYRLRFSESGIDFKTSNIDSKLQWSLYHSWRMDPNFYTLYYGKRELTVVPRRALDTIADGDIQSLLRSQLGLPKS